MKASKRRARAKKQSKNKIAMPAAFSELEEAFFREGAQLSVASSGPMESFADLEDSRPRPSLWRRLFA
jgi:hypothetical protein